MNNVKYSMLEVGVRFFKVFAIREFHDYECQKSETGKLLHNLLN